MPPLQHHTTVSAEEGVVLHTRCVRSEQRFFSAVGKRRRSGNPTLPSEMSGDTPESYSWLEANPSSSTYPYQTTKIDPAALAGRWSHTIILVLPGS